MTKTTTPPIVEKNPTHLDHSVLSFFLDYWRTSAQRSERAVPLFSTFKPGEVRANLAWVTVAEALPELSDFRYRVFGTCVTEYFGKDATGLALSRALELWDAPSREIMLKNFQSPCLDGVLLRCSGSGFRIPETNKFLPDFDSLYLPYSTDGRETDRVLNVFAFDRREVHKVSFAGWRV